MVIFTDICRICSKYDNNNNSLLDELCIGLNELGNMLLKCLDIMISPFDQLPNQICSPCTFQLRMFNEFKSSALIIQRQFNLRLIRSQKIVSSTKIKTENVDNSVINSKIVNSLKNEQPNNQNDENDLEFIEEFLEMTDNECDNDDDDDDDDDENNVKTNDDNEETKSIYNKNENCIDIAITEVTDEDGIVLVNVKEEEIEEDEEEEEEQAEEEVKTDNEIETLSTINEDTTTIKKLFKCKFCLTDDTYYDETEFFKHISLAHANKICTICDKIFATSWILGNHMLRHSDDRTIQCDRCPKKFKTKNNLYIHKRVHDDYRKYVCHLCAQAFRAHSHLKNHLDSHGAELKYSCTYCSMKLKTKLTLKSHIRALHTNLFDFKCSICPKTFGVKSRYERHLRCSHKLEVKPSSKQ